MPEMKKLLSLFILSLMLLMSGCSQHTDCNTISEDIESQFNAGNFEALPALTDSLRKCCPEEQDLTGKADSLVEISHRVSLDFSLTRQQVIERLGSYKIDTNAELTGVWEKENWLECLVINGEKRYFNRTASNLRLLNLFHDEKEKRDEMISNDPDMIFRKNHVSGVIGNSSQGSQPVMPVDVVITYSLTVNPDAVPEGETIRCWLPFPKESNIRQKEVKLISASAENYIIAPDSTVHRTIYMEGKSRKGEAAIFRVSFSFRSYARYFDPSEIKAMPYNKNSVLYKKYTTEQLPQICFTENVKRAADSITSQNDPPAEIVRKIYMWFKENIPWTGALEYSIMPNIPEYVIRNRRGDCGMQTLLFMSMLRYKGIPVRWQSGWMVPPGAENLHDWCEVYFEGTGWVPCDISYDLQPSENTQIREFYLSGIDSYRMIVNDGIAGSLFPSKTFMRSEPYDFQRGEVEWSGGNLYFDKWDYDIEIKYQK